MIDDILKLISEKDTRSVISEIKNHNVDSLDIISKLIYMNRLSDVKWFFLQLKINGYIMI